jgi:hypothetical protein
MLGQLTLSASAAAKLVSTHVCSSAFKIVRFRQTFYRVFNYFQQCISKTCLGKTVLHEGLLKSTVLE